ncbi:hypothetical protein BO78DRAFT_184786 [Aspergillus sclerotiicarbonarius CBS 121057]|uniref:Uncharacterized protein n=1 Tax=Aspergillus sclerotiicarbonarius (strain CBS 121057 / IBT 28362) TaxID=1448318 RepID=A0A319F026_ASPSB|nr:hypothetical protein BO78DRAFT_184786 [Aspergillus sclerotiicarbonarius CBS 121057]
MIDWADLAQDEGGGGGRTACRWFLLGRQYGINLYDCLVIHSFFCRVVAVLCMHRFCTLLRLLFLIGIRHSGTRSVFHNRCGRSGPSTPLRTLILDIGIT